MTGKFIAALVRFSVQYAWVVLIAALIAGGFAARYDIQHFGLDSQTENLVSPNAPWRAREQQFDREFPQTANLIDVVIDSESPERAEDATARLAARLSQQKQFFLSVRRPDAGPFFEHDAILLLPTADVQSTTAQIIKAQPFLGALAADPSLRGVFSSLSTVALGIQHGQAKFSELGSALTALTTTLGDVEAGKPAYLSWRSMVTGAPASIRETRRFIQVKPRLDFTRLMAGATATEAIRASARALDLTPKNGVRVRLTGPVPMADEEFATIADHAVLLGILILASMVLMLWLAVRSFRIIAAILTTLLIGLAITAAAGLALVGPFNVISIAFIPLFVGLGVDFGIQFSVRYRAERHEVDNLRQALIRAGASIGGALTLAAAAIAVGFLSFAPTDYAGLAKLGIIAGDGMLITFALSLTFLPAMLMLLKPGVETAEIGWERLAPVDRFIARKHLQILRDAGVLGFAGLGLLFFLHFDFNPLDLRSPKTQAVATALDLMKHPETSPNTIDVLVPNHAAAKALATKLSRVPEVSGVLSIDTFIPKDQDKKLAILSDASSILDLTINPIVTAPPPSDAQLVASLRSTAAALRSAAAVSHEAGAANAVQLARVLDKLADGSPALRARATAALVPGMNVMLDQIRGILQAQPVSLATLPPDLVRDWVTPDGAYRLEVQPRGDVSTNAALARFTRAVTAVAPEATGTPIVIQESGRTIVNAFIQAGILSLLAITILLALWLRNLADVVFALVPLVLAFILTLATSVIFGIQLNFANIIALPLLFGIGVAFDIYFVIAWRSGTRNLLRSPLGRAVILSACTTAFGFGTLSFSSHPGTASMGDLLLISLAWILVLVLIVLPALLMTFAPRH
jgi:hopanoid biosynthesis associated RND transporter like protein HpnN